jgi:hypothetical protein
MRLLIAAALLGTAAAPALADTRDFRVAGFDRVASSGPWDVRIHTGKEPSAHADGPKDMLDRLQIEVVGGELRVGNKPGNFFSFGWHAKKVVVDVTLPMLTALSVSGPGDVEVDRVHHPRFAARLSGPADVRIAALDTQDLGIDLSGPGSITLAGRAGRASVHLSGPGNVRGKALTVGDTDIHLSGPGDIALDVFGNATGSVSGPGDVVLTGKPHCSITKTGPGSIRCG